MWHKHKYKFSRSEIIFGYPTYKFLCVGCRMYTYIRQSSFWGELRRATQSRWEKRYERLREYND